MITTYSKDSTSADITDAIPDKSVTITVEDSDRTRFPNEKSPIEEMTDRIRSMSRREFRKFQKRKKRK